MEIFANVLESGEKEEEAPCAVVYEWAADGSMRPRWI